jgi:hypothetical protein
MHYVEVMLSFWSHISFPEILSMILMTFGVYTEKSQDNSILIQTGNSILMKLKWKFGAFLKMVPCKTNDT